MGFTLSCNISDKNLQNNKDHIFDVRSNCRCIPRHLNESNAMCKKS